MLSTDETQSPLQLQHHQDLLHRITLRIRQSLELQEILETTTAEVRSLLGTDRVKIYRFHADGSGEVIAESIHGDRLPSLLGLNFPADDIPPYARELFIKSRQRVVVDIVTQTTTGASLRENLNESTTQEPEQQLRYRPVDPCHVEYLTAMGVRSSVVVPILHDERLWGLLVSHHSQQRHVSEVELQFIQAVTDQVEVAIAQSTLLSQMREQAEREAKINQLTTVLHRLPTVQLQAALETVVEIFQASGGRLYLMSQTADQADQFYVYGEQPTELINGGGRQIEQHLLWQQYLRSPDQEICKVAATQDSGQELWSAQRMQSMYLSRGERPNPNCWAINDIYQEPIFRTIVTSFQSTQVRGLLIVPLRYGKQAIGCLTVFRNEIETERLWAGRCDNDKRQIMAQISFETWRELRRGQAKPWTENEKKLAEVIAGHLVMAVQQYRLYSQVQSLNANLERQVEERTAELQHLLEQQQALSNGIAKIRASLKLGEIFQTTTEEVYRLLQVDRVVIYQFNPDWSGSFIAEAVREGWSSLQETQTSNASIQSYISQSDRCIVKNFLDAPVPNIDTYLQETQGGDFSRGCAVKRVDDVDTMNFPDCYRAVLKQFHCQAYVIVPIFQADKLWGLLGVYQNSGPRQWKDIDIALVMQTSDQLGVAIQQAELLEQTQSRTQQLTKTLEDLKQTQTQLVQTEKMSSLGQLVAGVAHEINNPISFIYGNVIHATEYIQQLLEVIRLYQQRYPEPDAELRTYLKKIDLDFITEDLPHLLSSMKIGTERIQEIVQSLRTFSRLDEAEFKSVDIHAGIDGTLMILAHRLKAQPDRQAIQIIKDYGQLPLVDCYPGQLNQVFMNLLSNAIDALEEQSNQRSSEHNYTSQIKISTRVIAEQQVRICIADNGIGMSESVRSRLFNPFFTTKPIGKGTGLGLSISYQIITDGHKGTLSCQSTPGQGTEFAIDIPIRHCSKL
ncbi:GAF domain-containing sensor histidine kinase [Fischerella thermalis]|uniref:GAF domain-containing sensor histidine kinase n=1 Tax=Fischerella thermalis TaxID=372787 RepID=UPI0019FCFDC4|nr:GAF domain-containing protein [Fischerella thermalis]MBF1990433.1 GAF domain-containing protein [Fischerella thermalis M58_A2018_009]